MKNIRILTRSGLAAMAALISLPTGSVAQTVADESTPTARLNIPENVTVFAKDDPNARRATAIVNGEIITGTDIDHRLALLLASNEGQLSQDELNGLRLQVLRNLIDETLQIQEAQSNDIAIDSAQIEDTYRRVAQSNFRTDTNALDKFLRENGSSPASLKRQIHGELAWSRVVDRNIGSQTNVSEEQVNGIIARLLASKGQDEYNVAEIYLSATPNNSAEIFENGRRIIQQIQQGGNFAAYAQQWSEASTAPQGGRLGWIRPGLLPAQLSQAAQSMAVGQIAGPIEIPGGFSILYLIDKRKIAAPDPRNARLNLKQLAISFPDGTSEAQATQIASGFSSAIATIRGCGDADRIAAELGATVTSNDGILVKDLPPQLQQTMLTLSIGEASQPFGSVEQGVRTLVLCGRDDPQATNVPSVEEMMARMEEEKITKRAQIYLRDLRRDAIISYN
ncbi:peptidylprolyl isomerase [Parasphingorhabdus sp. DH2-15]|uniref:peptidylprolyl isomerase n=1 Tax=Parasphingorhabdus sp. DH2-15 TaxID=3444112 RepID=UPI003F687D20